MQHNPKNLDKQYIHEIPKKYLHFRHGLAIIVDKSSKQIMLAIRFLPFIDMTTNEYKEYEMISTTLVSMAKGVSLVKTNAAQKTRLMYTIGWRGGMLYMPSCICKYL